uniref:AHNAK nucleoprotein n=1 Tax=Cynoglossus semilaevis TaxID=244447 RepID=A0A3P8V1F9_CYNSE
MPSIDVSLPKGKGKIEGPDVEFEGDASGKFQMPYVKMPDIDVSLPKAKVEGPDLELKGKGGKFKMPHLSMPSIDVSLPKGKGKIEGPDFELEGDAGGKFKMPDVKMPDIDVSLPKAKVEGPDLELKGKGGKFKMPHLSMPSVDISLPKGKGKIEGADVEFEGDASGKFQMPYVKMPDIDVSLPKAKVEGPDLELKGKGGKFKMPHLSMPSFQRPYVKMPDIDVSLPKAKVEGPDLELKGKGGKFKMPHLSMPSVDISLPKGKGKTEGPDVELEGDAGGKFKMPDVKMSHVDISLPKGKIKGPDLELKGEGGKFKMPHLSMPSVDISLPKGKGKIEGADVEFEGDASGKFQRPYVKMPDIDVSLPKAKVEGPDLELKGKGGKFKMPHLSMPSVDISLPKGKGKIEGPDVDFEGDASGKFQRPYVKMPDIDVSLPKAKVEGPDLELKGKGGKFKMPHLSMPSIDVSLPKGKGKIEGPDFELEGDAGGKFKMPYVKMPDIDVSLPKAKVEGPDLELKGKGGKFKMPHLSMPSTEGPDVEFEADAGGKFKMPDVKMSHVDISLPKGKIKGPDLELKGEGGKFYLPEVSMPSIDVSLPKGKGKTEGPDVELEGDAGGKFKMPHMKMPDIDVSLPKINLQCPEMELEGDTRNVSGILSHDSPPKDTDITKAKFKGPVSKVGVPMMDIKGPKGDLKIDLGLYRGHNSKEKKKVELPDLPPNIVNTSSKVKGPKIKGTKFNIGMPKKKLAKGPLAQEQTGIKELDVQAKQECKLQEPEGERQVPKATLLDISVNNMQESSADTNVLPSPGAVAKIPMIPDIDFDIGTSLDKNNDPEQAKKIKIPKFGIPLPSISSPEDRMYGPETQYEGTKMPKVKKAVFVLVSNIQLTLSDNKIKPNFGKSKDKLSAFSSEMEWCQSSGQKSPGQYEHFNVTTEKSSLRVEKKISIDSKGTFSGKMKLPTLELTSPSGKLETGEDHKEISGNQGLDVFLRTDVGDETKAIMGEKASAGFTERSSIDVVSSHARTDLLDRDSSESPSGSGIELLSTQACVWSEMESKSTEDRELTSRFKIPKFSLKPHTGKDAG